MLRAKVPVTIRPKGLSDAQDGTNAFPGAMVLLQNLVPAPHTQNVFVPRPAASKVIDFTNATPTNPNGVVSEMLVSGSRVYGMVSSAQFAGKDEPFCYDFNTGTFITITNVTSALCPTAQPTTGEWVPPVMRAITNTYFVVTHPGFPGGSSPNPYFGWIDTSGYSQTILGNTTNGSPTLDSVVTTVGNSAPILQGVQPGQLVTGAGIPANTYVLSCSNGTFSLNTTGNTHTSTTLDNLGSTTGVKVGMTVSGAQFAAGTYVAAIVSGTQVTLNQAAIGTATGTPVNFAGGGQVVMSANASATANLVSVTIAGGTKSAPRWGAGNTNTNAMTTVPKTCYGFNSRCYFGSGPYLIYSDPLLPLQVSLASQALLVGNSTDITALAGVPLTSQLTGGIQQSMTIFKGAEPLWQVTGDAATNNFGLNVVAGSVGTLSPRSIVGTPNGLMFLAADGLRLLGLSGTQSEPLNTDGKGISVPFINALYISRIVAAFSKDVYRATVQDASQPGNPMSEYWYDLDAQVWTGPHTSPARAAQGYASTTATFLIAPFNVNGQIWRSDCVPAYNSSFTENGTRLQCAYRTVLLPDNGGESWNKVMQGTLVMSLAAADFVLAQVDDDRGNTLGACSFNGQASSASIWQSFNWGSGTWGAASSLLREYPLKFPKPLTFRQARVTAGWQAASGQAIGNLYVSVQPVNLNIA